MEYRRVQPDDFEKIVVLQNKNLLSRLTESEKADGFLSTAFTLEQFKEMDRLLCVVVAVEEGQICGYVCASPPLFHQVNPLWGAMLTRCSQILYKGKPFHSHRFFVGSPICIDKKYRGGGIYLGLCHKILELIPKNYDFVVAFISTENQRNVKAVQKVGFELVDQFQFKNKTYWIVVLSLSK